MEIKESDIQGLLFKLAEVETLVVVLLSILGSNGTLTQEQVSTVFDLADIPEVLAARIQHIEDQGKFLVDARGGVWESFLKQSKKSTALAEEVESFANPWDVIDNPKDEDVPAVVVKRDGKKDTLH